MEMTTKGADGSPSATADRWCDRIEESDPAVHAFVAGSETYAARRERVREEARSVHERWPDPGSRPPLFAVPVAVKDLVRVDGLPTRAGSALPAELFEGRQAGVVDRLREAGALVAGKTVTAEFAMSAPGPTRNPHAHDHTPGGSSSGSAAAVAAGMVPLAIGTQTVGSVVRPAAYCGVVGFKPTFGRIPIDGVIANAPSLDTLGIFATTLAVAATAAAALCDGWQPLPDTAPGPPVLGVPDGPYLERAGTEARTAFELQVAALSRAGFPVRRVAVFADFARDVDDLLAVNRHEAAQVHRPWFARYRDLYRDRSVATIRQGQQVARDRYESALRAREAFRADLLRVTGAADVDVWISPAATGPAPFGLAGTGDPAMCVPWSYAGWPSVSVPAGWSANGLPLGLQCVSRAGADERLLEDWAPAVAAALPTGARGLVP